MAEIALTISIIALIYSIYVGQTNRQIELEKKRQILIVALFESAILLVQYIASSTMRIKSATQHIESLAEHTKSTDKQLEDNSEHIKLLDKLSGLADDIVGVRNKLINMDFGYLFFCSPVIRSFISMETQTKEIQKLTENCIRFLEAGDFVSAERHINFLDLTLNKGYK